LIQCPLCPYLFDNNWRSTIPKFVGSNAISTEEHIRNFNDFVQDLGIEQEDVLMRLFMMSLTDEGRDWFKNLPHTSIVYVDDFKDQFLE
jgi:hypothetical protein